MRTDRRHDPVFHRLFGQKLHCPTGASFWCFGAGERNDLRFMFSGEGRWLAGTGRIMESAIHAVQRETGTHIDDGPMRCSRLLRDVLVRVSGVGLEKNPGTANHARRVTAFARQFIQLSLLFCGKMNGEFLHGEQSLI